MLLFQVEEQACAVTSFLSLVGESDIAGGEQGGFQKRADERDSDRQADIEDQNAQDGSPEGIG